MRWNCKPAKSSRKLSSGVPCPHLGTSSRFATLTQACEWRRAKGNSSITRAWIGGGAFPVRGGALRQLGGPIAIAKAADGPARRRSPAFSAWRTTVGAGPGPRRRSMFPPRGWSGSFARPCGTQMAYRAADRSDRIFFYDATLEHPERFTP